MVTSILYQLFLQPLETLYRVIFDLCQTLVSGNILLALLLLSLISSFVLAAVERKAVKYVNKEKIIQDVLGKQLAKIKAEFHGVERQQKIKSLYSRYSYNPLYSARASLGVLSQLPFLLGAYLMLLHNDTLKGVAIWKFADISEPDGLLFGLNLLPVLMLVVNVLNSLLSTWLTRKEKLTALVIGLVFFILLYAAPACMLIYWTTNNLIQLLKTVWKRVTTGRDGKDNVVRLMLADALHKLVLHVKTLLNIQLQLKRLKHAFYEYPGASSLFVLVVLACGWMLVRFGEKMSHYCHLSPENAKDPNCTESLMLHLYDQQSFLNQFSYSFAVVLLLVLFALVREPLMVLIKDGKAKYGLMSFLLRAFIAFASIIWCVIYLTHNASTMYQVHGKLALMLIFAVLVITQFGKRKELFWQLKPDNITLNKSKTLFMPAVLVVAGLIVIYSPTMLFLSDPQALGETFYEYTQKNFSLLLVVIFTSALIYYISNSRTRIILSTVLIPLAILSILYALIIIPNLGTLQNFKFTQPKILEAGVFKNQDIALSILAILITYVIYKTKKLRLMSTILYVFLAYVFVVPFISYQQNAKEIDKLSMQFSNDEVSSDVIPENIQNFFTFSSQDNILVVALDAFTGGNVRELIKMYPELKNDLDGFVWFEDSITAGEGTPRGIQGIVGGEPVNPVRFQNDIGVSQKERINRGWAYFMNYLIDKGYEVNLHEPLWLSEPLIVKHLSGNKSNARFITGIGLNNGFLGDKTQIRMYTKLFNKDSVDAIAIPASAFTGWYGLYSVMPSSQKHKVYLDGKWNYSVNPENWAVMTKTVQFSQSELLPYLSSVKEIKPQYKFVHLVTTHDPFNMDAKCNVIRDNLTKRNDDYTLEGHLNVEYCSLKSLGKFFKWMKKNGIYDKTQIFVMSDHSEHDVSPITDDSKLTANGIGFIGNSKYFPWHNASYALFLSKERNASGELKVNSDYLMQNLDVPLLIKHALGDELSYEPYKDPHRIRINVCGDWNLGGNVQHNTGAFVVRGHMFDKSHWTVVTEPEEIKGLWKLLYDKE